MVVQDAGGDRGVGGDALSDELVGVDRGDAVATRLGGGEVLQVDRDDRRRAGFDEPDRQTAAF